MKSHEMNILWYLFKNLDDLNFTNKNFLKLYIFNT